MAILGKEREALRKLAETTGVSMDALVTLAEGLVEQTKLTEATVVGMVERIMPQVSQFLAVSTDAVMDFDKLLEAVPEQWKALVHAMLSASSAGERTVMRVSELVQAYRAGVHLEIDMLPIQGGGTKFKGTVKPNV